MIMSELAWNRNRLWRMVLSLCMIVRGLVANGTVRNSFSAADKAFFTLDACNLATGHALAWSYKETC